MKTHYDVIREYTEPGLLGSGYHLAPKGPISGMNAKHAGSDKCLTCAGYKVVKVQSGFGDVEYPMCGDCLGEGTRAAYDSFRPKRRRFGLKGLLLAFVVLVIILFTVWDVTK